MGVTLLLSLILMAALFLMLYAAVALVQSKKLFGSAPKDIQAAITEHKERFPNARRLGWKLVVLAVSAFAGAFLYGALDGIHRGYGFRMFFVRFLTMLYLEKAISGLFSKNLARHVSRLHIVEKLNIFGVEDSPKI